MFNGTVFTNTVFIFVIIWILIITLIVFRVWRHYNHLTQGVTHKNLRDVLESLLNEYKSLKTNLTGVEKELKKVEEDGNFHIQRVGLVRFNPFSDTGGSQSFTIAILDGKANGLVLTSLYARTGNRWYVKEVGNGKGKEMELSKEELAAIGKATAIKHNV